ncbi:enolase-phosphatase E1-like [Camellia sinensis]|uniref:enolase-phosphatase E1-like n=1 Tax=Camellia sinensis TaxID=4442 RepID=UPI0010368E32|nr:enolase-phosphatase E1-like [Camellia sinensis]
MKEVAGLLKTTNKAEAKMKTLIDQAKTAKQAQDEAEKRSGAAEAIAKVLEAEKKKAEAKTAKAQAKIIAALATKDAEIKVADEKAYAEGAADIREDYKKQDEAESKEEAEAKETEETEAVGAKFPTLNEQVLDLTQDKEDEVQKTTSKAEVETSNKSLDDTLREIDAEVQAEKSTQLSVEADTTPIAEAEQTVENA